jgi:hypothetical protein
VEKEETGRGKLFLRNAKLKAWKRDKGERDKGKERRIRSYLFKL